MSRTKTALALALCVTGILNSACFEGKTVVTRVQPPVPGAPRPKLNGVFFALPRTVVKVDLPVIREVKKAGQFSKLSPFFFSGEPFVAAQKDDIKETDLEPNLTKTPKEGKYFGLDDPKFSTRGEPDPDQTFMVNIRGGKFETKTLMLEVTEDGIIAKAEAESKNEAIDFLTEGLKTAVSIAAPVFPFGPLADQPPQTLALADTADFCGALWSVLSPRERILCKSLSEDYKRFLQNYIGLDYLAQLGAGNRGEKPRIFFWSLTDRQIQYYEKNFDDAVDGYPDPNSDLIRAKLAFDKIQDLIAKRAGLITTEPVANATSDVITAKLKEVDNYILSYKQAYFIGKSDTATWVGNFEFAPPAVTPYVVGLLSYSESNGICAITGGKGPKGVYPPAKFMASNCDQGKSVLVQLTADASQMSENVKAANFHESGERGFYYRVPAKVSVALCEENLSDAPRRCQQANEFARDDLAIAQYGTIASLPASTGGRRSSYKVVYYSSTGAIQTFNIASDALIQKSNLSDIETTAKELRDAKTEKIKRDTERLKAEKDYLDAKDALKKAKEGNSNGTTP